MTENVFFLRVWVAAAGQPTNGAAADVHGAS